MIFNQKDMNMSKDTDNTMMTEEGSSNWDTIRVTPSPDALCTLVDGEAVVLHLGNGFYYSLNPVGATIWEEFSKGHTIEHIVETVCEEYDVTKDVAKKDLADLLADLSKEGLILQEVT